MPDGVESGRAGSVSRRGSVSASQHSSIGDNTTNCGACSKAITTDCIECESCKHWFDLRCAKLNSSDLKTIKKPGVHWLCEKCDDNKYDDSRSSSDISDHGKRIEILEKSLENIKKSIDESFSKHSEIMKVSYADVLKKLDNRSEDIQGSIEKQCDQIVRKQQNISKEREKQLARTKNVIIFGIQEAETLSTTIDNLKSIFEEKCHFDIGRVALSPTNVHRIGAKQQGKNRPIRILLDSEVAKWELLKRLNSQRIEGVFARLDLSKEEQERDFQLRKELRKKNEENPDLTFKIVKHRVVQVTLEKVH